MPRCSTSAPYSRPLSSCSHCSPPSSQDWFIAFILNILLRVLENKLFAPLNRYAVWRKIRRAVCVVLCYVLVILLIVLLVQFVVPEFVQNLTALGEALPITSTLPRAGSPR